MSRLNSGIFRIFQPSLGNFYPISSNFRALKIIFRGLRRNQIIIPNIVYKTNVSYLTQSLTARNKLNTNSNFKNETSTHVSATHAISKIGQKSKNRIPRELDRKFGIPTIGTIHWVGYFGLSAIWAELTNWTYLKQNEIVSLFDSVLILNNQL